jgi:acyl-ACP thioesterase
MEALVGVFSSTLSDSLFEKPFPLKNKIIDPNKHQANVSFNDDGTMVYFS